MSPYNNNSNKYFILYAKQYETVILSSDFPDGVGIGIEIVQENVGEIVSIFFIKDSNRKVISIYQRDVPLELVEKAISIFNEEIMSPINNSSTNA